MARFSLKDVLRGLTATSIGFAMLSIAFRKANPSASEEISLGQAFLVAFGGTLVGYGLAFPFKWPPHQMTFAMIGMFAAQAWQSGSRFGLIVFVCIMALVDGFRALRSFTAKRDSAKGNSPPSP